MNKFAKDHTKTVQHVMNYVVSTTTRGCKSKPEKMWDGKNCDLTFKIKVSSDSDFFACKSTKRSIMGYFVFM